MRTGICQRLLLMSIFDTYTPSSAVWRAIRGTGEDVREPTGETERLPPSDPRFMI
jgi:hypothetical protein